MNADLGGDCDTVGAIAGQIAGAMYGIDKDLLKLYS
jgi:ADP-ribosylglycohydrolase